VAGATLGVATGSMVTSLPSAAMGPRINCGGFAA
jgi:hypothetical protein